MSNTDFADVYSIETKKVVEKFKGQELTIYGAIKALRGILLRNPKDIEAKLYLCKFLCETSYGKEEAKKLLVELIVDPKVDFGIKNLAAEVHARLAINNDSCGIYRILVDEKRITLKELTKILNVYIKLGNYQYAYDILSHMDLEKYKITESDLYIRLKNYSFFLEYRLGLIRDVNYNKLTYTQKQIVKYNYKLAIEHISRHQYEDLDKAEHSTFVKGTDIPDLFNELTLLLDNAEFYSDGYADVYQIEMDRAVGFVHGVDTKHIKVATIAGTKNIITIHPITVKSKNKSYQRNKKASYNNN